MESIILFLTKPQLFNAVRQALLVLFMFFLLTFSSNAQNQITDCADFECENIGDFPFFSLSGVDGEISNDAYNGLQSFKLGGEGEVARNIGPDYVAGMSYTFSLYTKLLANGGNAQVSLTYLFYDANWGVVTTQSIPVQSALNAWAKASITFTVPEGGVYLVVGFKLVGTNSVCLFDDAFLGNAKEIQSVDVTNITKFVDDADFDLPALSSRGLPVNYNIADPSIANIIGNKVQILNTGQTIITATQEGNESVEALIPLKIWLTVKEVGSTLGSFYRVDDFSTAADGWYSNIGAGHSASIATDFMVTPWAGWSTGGWRQSVARVKMPDSDDVDAAFLKQGKNSLLILPAAIASEATSVSASLQYQFNTVFGDAKKVTIYFAGSQSTASDFEALVPNPTVGYENIAFDDFNPANHNYQLTVADFYQTTRLSSPQYNDRGVWHKWEVELVNFDPIYFGVNSSIRGTGTLKGVLSSEDVVFGTPVIIGAIVVDFGDENLPTNEYYPQNLALQTVSGLSDISLIEGGKLELSATTSSGEELIYFIDDYSIATIDGTGKISALKEGETTLTAIQAGTSEYASIIKTVKLTVTPGSSIGETEGVSVFALVENPVKDEALFSFESAENGTRIVISDLTGKIVAQQAVVAGATEASILVSNLSSGVYLARYMDNSGKVSTIKFIK